MHVFDRPDNTGISRPHRWKHAESDPRCLYYDFRKQPELIRTSLEDFRPFDKWPAIQRFYALLEWLAIDPHLESNDCAFWEPRPTTERNGTFPLQCDGRLMILFHELRLNTVESAIKGLYATSYKKLLAARSDPWSRVGLTISCCHFEEMPDVEGWQLAYYFWAWGNDTAEAMAHLDLVFQQLEITLREISTAIGRGDLNGIPK